MAESTVGIEITSLEDLRSVIKANDTYGSLKKFMRDLLAVGKKITYGEKGEIFLDTSAAYAAWLYQNCENPSFTKNFERGLKELLEEEFKFGFYSPENCIPEGVISFDLTADSFTRFGKGSKINLGSFLYDTNKDKPVFTGNDILCTESDILSSKDIGYVNSSAHFKNTATAEKHLSALEKFEYASKELVRTLLPQLAAERYKRQATVLIGLLEIIAEIGEPSETFGQISSILAERIQEGIFKEVPDIKYPELLHGDPFSGYKEPTVNLYALLEKAENAVRRMK